MEQYLTLLKTIKEKGTYKPAAREGMPGTQSLFGYQFRHDLSKGFPLLTTKKMFWKGVVVELLWFLRGDANIKYLLDNGVNIWNEDAYNYYVKTLKRVCESHSTPWTIEDFIKRIQSGDLEPDLTSLKNSGYKYGDCGFQYGRVWRKWGYQAPLPLLKPAEISEEQLEKFKEEWLKQAHNLTPMIQAEQLTWIECKGSIDQIKNVITSLKNFPSGRRHVVTAWDPAHDNDLALTWCHALFQFNCRPISDFERKLLLHKLSNWKEVDFAMIDEDPSGDIMQACDEEKVPKYYLDCQLYQRSADVVLGVPFNIASYALLTKIFAKICNMIPGEFIHTFGDVHIYDNHKDAVEEQLLREPKELPTLRIADEGNDWAAISNLDFNLIEMMSHTDFRLENYNPHPKLESETKLSTGLK